MIINYSELDTNIQDGISQTVSQRLKADFGREVQSMSITQILLMFNVSVGVNSGGLALQHDESLEAAVRYLSARF